jgi:hypothetical protein
MQVGGMAEGREDRGGTPPSLTAQPNPPEAQLAPVRSDDHSLLSAGFVRDERGLRFVGEAGD